MLHAGDNLTRALKIEADEDFAEFSHFLAFKNADGTVFVTVPITLNADGTAEYQLTADLCPKAGYLEVQLISSGGANEPHVKKSHIYKVYVDPSILIPDNAETPDGRYITIYQLSERLDVLEEDIGEKIEQYLSTHPISGAGVSFDNKGTDITSNDVQGALVELAERGGTSIPSYTLYGYKSLTTAQKTHNAEQVQKITSDESNAFICTMLTDNFKLSLNSLWYYDEPEFEYFDTTNNTHYKYIANKDGTVTIQVNKNADPSAVQSSTAPTESTSGAFVGQLCIVNNGTAVYVYKGLISNVHLWMQIPTMKDIPSLAGYATEIYVTEAISTALGSVETALQTITTGGGVE